MPEPIKVTEGSMLYTPIKSSKTYQAPLNDASEVGEVLPGCVYSCAAVTEIDASVWAALIRSPGKPSAISLEWVIVEEVVDGAPVRYGVVIDEE